MANDNHFATQWTEGAIECYQRGCRCTGCYIKEIMYPRPCLMKKAVIELVRKFGAPEER